MTYDSETPESLGHSAIIESRRDRLADAKKSYEQAINRLWAGIAAGMFAVLGAFATGKAQGILIFTALCSFVLGLLLLAFAAFWSLLSQAKIIRELEDVNSLLDLNPTSVIGPSDEAGLTRYNLRTTTGLLSACLFFAGVGCGLFFAVSGIPSFRFYPMTSMA